MVVRSDKEYQKEYRKRRPEIVYAAMAKCYLRKLPSELIRKIYAEVMAAKSIDVVVG